MSEVRLERKVLERNDALAADNRDLFRAAGAYTVNLISSPGSGKTSLLEATLGRLAETLRVGVVEGDVQTENDARRIEATGVPVEAIVTGGACHLDASMVRRGFRALVARAGGRLDLLVIENVGNLVCPASYDLGEDEKVALVSVTEGEDKPLKYPALFHAASVLLVTKIDLLPHLDFDVEALVRNARSLRPGLAVFRVSARTGDGLDAWVSYLVERVVGRPRSAVSQSQ
ncbi:MAG: hydrogenase nickel incorporation protein HypB [Deltaproteobacteria bacterium]|nr:hydrogenase nickel incorporation protein HypB [Deltaproteobacteria bacterium]